MMRVVAGDIHLTAIGWHGEFRVSSMRLLLATEPFEQSLVEASVIGGIVGRPID